RHGATGSRRPARGPRAAVELGISGEALEGRADKTHIEAAVGRATQRERIALVVFASAADPAAVESVTLQKHERIATATELHGVRAYAVRALATGDEAA